MSKSRFIFAVLVCAVALVGCDKPTELGHVTGTVMMDGKPLGDVRVLFVPQPDENGDGVYSDCFTGKDGKYDLIYSGVTDEVVHGAILGNHTVAVEDFLAEESRGELPIRIPDEYSSGARSPLKFEVKAGDNSYDIVVPKPKR